MPWSIVDTVLLGAITFVAGAIRVTRLGTPARYIWDEFYGQDACFYLHMPAAVCDTSQELTWQHPPLGKWLLAPGILMYGYSPFGRRVAAAAMGTLAVALLYVLARKILHSRLGGAVAAALMAIDWLHFVQSRVAMPDVFLTTFGIAALLCLSCDRDRLIGDGIDAARDSNLTRFRWWRIAAGVMAGAAIAIKWSGALILLTVVALTVVWEVAVRRTRGVPRPVLRAVKEEWLSFAAAFVVIPIVIYVVSYAGDVHSSFAGDIDGTLVTWPWRRGSWFRALVRRQATMVLFHRTYVGTHYYASAGWSWPFLKRPTVFFFDGAGGQYREILATGNPFVWWPALAALLYIAATWVRRRNPADPHGMILATFAANYLPWIYLSRIRQFGFIYYFVPAIPSICLALALVAVKAGSTTRGRILLGGGLAIATLLFATYYPILSAVPISPSAWKWHMLFRDCQGAIEPGVRGGEPPPGWCWI